ncbi:low molecular weight protein-tyrosine-phosphatase [Paraburkholderia phytofirmans]|uniref:low molecular weight protein-tyrosine-phosphatase n=1 Tax=Paraburkholderia phytofirmans TaxID=261302 RepID=UPI0009EE474E|nr:low molecular weight protein-tyrosine-phosphatase [Paraburkholderia phytofirmans]
MFHHILIVCTANICRSPIAEVLFRERLTDRSICVDSAGLSALVGREMCKDAAKMLSENGYDGSRHRAQQLTMPMLHSADLVLVMQDDQVSGIVGMAPEARGKVLLLGKWQGDATVPDPYRLSKAAYQHAYRLIDQAVESWIKYI